MRVRMSHVSAILDLQDREKGFLGNLDGTDLLHPLFASFLFFQQLVIIN